MSNTVSVVRFNVKDRPEFYAELRKRVNAYFKENQISRYANANMVIKTIFMITLYFTPLVLMISGVITGFWPVMAMWVLMGLGMSGIGLSIMHDANHGSYSKNPRVNKALGYLINFIGGYHINWKIQHNVLHHSFTNVEGFDEDIDNYMFRFAPGQIRRPMHRYQAFYAPLFYGLMTLNWLIAKDFIQLRRYHKKNLLAGQGITMKDALPKLIFNKVWYFTLMLALPLIFANIPWWNILLGFFTMHFICGILLALIFQSAHVISETDFYRTDAAGSVENNWAIHQLHTTANFATGNPVLSWLIGGLNYQVEHHLFPNICHVHYSKISRIVKATATEYGIPYYSHRTFTGALKSHFGLLHNLGTGRLEKTLA